MYLSLSEFATARELTERWHQQQQIRFATNRPGMEAPGDAKVFKKYSQMKLQMKREALVKLNRMAHEQNSVKNLGYDSEGELMGFDTVLTQFATKTQQSEAFRKAVQVATSWKWFRMSRATKVGA